MRKPQWTGLCLLILTVLIYTVYSYPDKPTPPAKTETARKDPTVLTHPVISTHRSEKQSVAIEKRATTVARTDTPSARQTTDEARHASVIESIIQVKNGDSMAAIFSRSGFSASLLDKVMRSGKEAGRLTHILPGDTIKFYTDKQGELHTLQYDIELFKTLEIRRRPSATPAQYKAELIHHPVERRIQLAQGIIQQSLFQATTAAGIPIKVAYQLADIFGWDIDFMRDLRENDAFFILYEELYKYGKKVGVGNITAAAFRNNGQTHRAFRYTNKQRQADYYDEEGRTLRKTFLRTPVEYKRISSYFSLKRKHPVLNRIRAHKGVDYAAPRGTPVKTTGDGIVQFAGRNGGYGRVIRIQHGQTYTTVYAHLSRYRRGIKKGRHVKQGEIIGYVGSSGLATGPHLHYEFRVNGVHRNPLKVKFPKSKPIPEEERAIFLQATQGLMTRIDLWENKKLAIADQTLPQPHDDIPR